MWHATSGTAALELVTGRASASTSRSGPGDAARRSAPKTGARKGEAPGLEVADRLSLARGPGGRSVLVELDPAQLRGTPSPERGKPGRKYTVTGSAPEAVRALVIGNERALARFAADPGVAARFDFAHPVETARGWRVERREPVTVRERVPEAHAALRQEIQKQLWRGLTERQLTGRLREKGQSIAAVPVVLAGLVQEGGVSVGHRGRELVYRVKPVFSAIEAPDRNLKINPLKLVQRKMREAQGQRRLVETFPDLEKATTWARANIRGLQFVNYEGMDLDVASSLTRNAFLIAHEYEVDVPAIMPRTWDGWKGKATDAFMSASGEGISFNPAMCQGVEKEIFLEGWSRADHTSDAAKGIDAIVAHELGHLLAENARTHKGTRLSRDTSRIIVEKYVQEFRSEVGKSAVIKELSAYAWYGSGIKTGIVATDADHETWAQAFSAYRTAPEKLSPRTVQLVETILHQLGMR